MKNHKPSRIRTLLLLALAAGGMGTASAGALDLGNVGWAPLHGGPGAFTFTLSNTSQAAASDVRVSLGGSHVAACAPTTAQGHPFAFSGSLRAGDSVQCMGDMQATGENRDATILMNSKGANGVSNHQSAHLTYVSNNAVPGHGIVGIQVGEVFNDTNPANGNLDANETIDYNYTVANLGNELLSGLVVTDSLGTVINCGGQTTLALGAAMVCTGTHTITTAEASAGTITNNVTINGADTDTNGTVSSSDGINLNNGDSPLGMRVLKSPLFAQDNDGNGYPSANDVVKYTFMVKNSGGVPLNSVNVTEDNPALIDGAISCAATTVGGAAFTGLGTGSLASGDTALCTAQYTIQPADVGQILTNFIHFTGLNLVTVSGSAFSLFTVDTPPNVAVTKTLVGESVLTDGLAEPGEVLTYNITLTNSGSADATNYGVTDVFDTHTTFKSADNGGGLDGVGNVVWTGLTVPGNGQLVLTVAVTVVNPLPIGLTQVANLAYATGSVPPACPPAGPQCVVTPAAPPPPKVAPTPVNDWRAMLLLALGLLAAGFMFTRRKQHSN